ncbi:GNAT family N-acetyltransferase [Pedobacter sp.]|uniref:GNAT family N-acetyltransferase n=1 Tax=Pedobacter sp. TaxID=1411316 RepID=UPI003D7F49A6
MYYRSFTIREETAWNSYIERSLGFEIYQTWYYHSLNKEGEPVLFVYEENKRFIALPLIKRAIEASSFYDMTSVYGYCGPVSNMDLSEVSLSTSQNFKHAFIEFLKAEQCISVFSRLHPFMNQQFLLQNIGGLKENGKTIYIDLTVPLAYQKENYEKRLNRQIRSLRKRGFLIKEATTKDDITRFTQMYLQNMDRLNASPGYYFDEQYFANLLYGSKMKNKLLLIFDGSDLICGALVLISRNIIRNHLSATSPGYLKDSPSKLLTDEISLLGRQLGKKIFHLGGGVGGREDSLYKYKSYFSNLEVEDRIWCYVTEPNIYNELVAQRVNILDSKSNFFPLYRKGIKQAPPQNIEI